MGYLYGDAVESSLDTNYLEFLRAVVDFSVGVLESSDRVQQLEEEVHRKKRAAATEREQLQAVTRQIEGAIQVCLDRAQAPVTNQCVHAIRGLSRGELDRAKKEIENGLAREISRIDEEIVRQRSDNHERLETLLLEHDLPSSRQWIDYRVTPEGTASAELVGYAAAKVSWNLELDIPSDHPLHSPLRVDRLFPQLAIEIPEMAGWVRKRIKLKTHKLTKEYVVGLAQQDDRAVLSLRSNLQDRDAGYDITYVAGIPHQVARLYKGTLSDPTAPEPADAPKLRALLDEVQKALGELRQNRRSLRAAKLDDKPISRHKQPSVLVERLITEIAPVVAEISQHSLSPTELVLKRVLADDQRVEIFLPKSELWAKVEALSADARRVFGPLELDQPNPVPGSLIPPPVTSSPPLVISSAPPDLPAPDLGMLAREASAAEPDGEPERESDDGEAPATLVREASAPVKEEATQVMSMSLDSIFDEDPGIPEPLSSAPPPSKPRSAGPPPPPRRGPPPPPRRGGPAAGPGAAVADAPSVDIIVDE
ncbi:MAG: hypothetical protein R3B72_28500 [Polyangiaceae bacterium]